MIMNRWLVSACFLCLLASCSKGDDASQSPDNPTNGGAEVNFSSTVRSSIVVEIDGPSTRAPLTNFETNSSVGLFGIPAIGSGANGDCNLFDRQREEDFQMNLFNAQYTYVAGYDRMQSDNQATFPYGSNPALMLYGYYPYTSQAKFTAVGGGRSQWAIPWQLTLKNSAVSQTVVDMSQTVDYMYVEPTLAVYNQIGLSPVVLNFQHALGRLDFCFYSTNKELCSAGYLIKKVIIECRAPRTGLMAITDGTLSGTSENLTCEYPISGSVGINYAIPGDAVAMFMLPPKQTLIQKITCEMLDGGANSRTYVIYDYRYSGYDITLDAQGKIVEMRVNFQPKDTSYSPPKVESWVKSVTYDVNVKLQ